MKIALLHYSAPPIVGGVETVLAHHARLMKKAGHEVRVLAGRGGTIGKGLHTNVFARFDSRHEDALRVKAQLDVGDSTPDFESLRERIRADIRDAIKHCDILFAHNVASLNRNLALTAALHDAYRGPDFPRLVLWHHDLAWTSPRFRNELHPGYPWSLLREAWQGATYVTPSAIRRRELGGLLGIPESSIKVIPNGVDLDSFFKLEAQTIQLAGQMGLGKAGPLFLLPARLTPRKNIELALQILVELLKRYPGAKLLVTGPEGPHDPANAAYFQKLLHLRDELGLKGAAHFLAEMSSEFIPDAVIADFYRIADALLFPSLEEGFGIPLIEAGVSSLPVFCADIPVLRELGGGDVTTFDPEGEPAVIARQIADRLEGEATSRWRRQAKTQFGWDSIYAAHIDPLIQEVMR